MLIQRHHPNPQRVAPQSPSQQDSTRLTLENAHDGPSNFTDFGGSAARRVLILAEYDWKGLTPSSLPFESIRPRGLWQWALALLLFVFLLAAPLAEAQVATSGAVSVPQLIIAIAGGGTTVPSSTTTVPATSAKIGPLSTAVDASGNVYFSDPTANLVERLDNSGNITVIAGGGSVVPNSTPMLGTAARLDTPEGIAVDKAGNVFIADLNNGKVEMWSPTTQQIEVIAGGGSIVPTTTPEAATKALITPFKLALDDAGNIYILDSARNLIEKLDIAGNIVLYAGGGSQTPSSTNSTPATSASIIFPSSLAVDSKGQVYLTDYNNSLIDMIYTASDSKQYIIVVAGGGSTVPSATSNVSSLSTKLENPTGIAVDRAGNLYVADGYGTIEKMRPAGNTFYVSVIAGAGQQGISSTAPQFPNDVQIGPYSVTVDGNGNLYLCDNRSALIELISAGTAFPTTWVAEGSTSQIVYVQLTSATPSMAEFGSAVVSQAQNGGQDFDVVKEAPITCPSVWTPTAHVPQCAIVVAFTPRYPGLRTGTLQLLNSTGTLIGTVGLSGTGMGPMGVFEPGFVSDLKIPASDLSSPYSATVDGAGNLYIADHDLSQKVVKVTPTGAESVITIPPAGGVDISMPTGIAVDGAGNMYLADYNHARVVKMTPIGDASVVNLGGLSSKSVDSVAVDAAGDLFIADSKNNDVLEVKSDGSLNYVSTGNLTLDKPVAVVVDGAGNLYIADYGNNRVVKVMPNGVASVLPMAGVTMYTPEYLALDGTGNLYIGDTYADVVEVTTGGDVFQLILHGSTSPVNNLGALAADGAGNLYLTDVSVPQRALWMDRSSMALEFVNTDQGKTSTDSPIAVTYRNIGNVPLAISTISYPTNFPENTGASTDCVSHSNLAAGVTCTLTINFSPIAQGGMGATDALSEMVQVNNNGATTFNGAQVIFVNGTETNIMSAAATPTVSPAFGTYDTTQTVTLSDTTPGAVIYYTTDGSTSTASSIKYTAPFTVSAVQTINAIAVAAGYANSTVISGTYTINLTTADPTFSPAAGTYTSAQSVTISDTTTGAVIYYTTDGSSPTLKSTVFSGPIQVGTSQTINAIALASGYSASAASTAVYTINLPAAATPTFSPVAGTYTSAQSVTIADTTTGAAIYYTTDGSIPTTASNKYTTAITASANETINAIAVAAGYSNSAVATAAYVINLPGAAATPTFSPAAGTYTSAQTVTIADSATGATIYYTIDGSTPTAASTKYTAAIIVSASETIKAIAVATGYTNSAIATAAYVINLPGAAATPTFSPAAGTYTSAQTVTIADSATGATIYYTIDGSTPTAASTKYTAAIIVSASETIKAIAVATGYTNSAIATAAYVINNLPSAAATPTFSPAAGTYTSAQTVTIADTTTGATIYYTIDGSTPTAASTKYTAAITVSTTETIKAIAVATGYTNSGVASALYTITPAGSPNFAVSASPSSLSIKGGQTGSATISVTPQNGFASAVSFTCSGLPTGATCSFSPAAVTPSGAAASTTLTVTTTATSAAVRPNSNPLFPGAALAAALCFLGWRRRRSVQLFLLLAVTVIGLSLFTGCGGGSSSSNSNFHTPVTTTVTVTGTSGSGSSLVQNTTTFSITIN